MVANSIILDKYDVEIYTHHFYKKLVLLLNKCNLSLLDDDDFKYINQLIHEYEIKTCLNLNIINKHKILHILKESEYVFDDDDFTILNDVMYQLKN